MREKKKKKNQNIHGTYKKFFYKKKRDFMVYKVNFMKEDGYKIYKERKKKK